jgi:hypothetical protein
LVREQEAEPNGQLQAEMSPAPRQIPAPGGCDGCHVRDVTGAE